jgi:hypothetical protein
MLIGRGNLQAKKAIPLEQTVLEVPSLFLTYSRKAFKMVKTILLK